MKKTVINILLVVIIGFAVLASYEKMMRYAVHQLPPTLFWWYNSIEVSSEEKIIKVGDLLKVKTDNGRNTPLRIIYEDYFFCFSDTGTEVNTDLDFIETYLDNKTEKRYRRLYTSTSYSGRGEQVVEWVFGQTRFSEGYRVQKPGENCYIYSYQIGLPYGEEIHQSYISGPFKIVE